MSWLSKSALEFSSIFMDRAGSTPKPNWAYAFTIRCESMRWRPPLLIAAPSEILLPVVLTFFVGCPWAASTQPPSNTTLDFTNSLRRMVPPMKGSHVDDLQFKNLPGNPMFVGAIITK